MRADAVRNRQAVLDAAGRLFDTSTEPDRITMDDVAAAAGVGKGTLFRGFGDRTGLIHALYEHRSAELADALNALPAGAPAERAQYLLGRMLQFKLRNRALTLTLERVGGGSPYRNSTYDRWHAELVELVTEARGPESAGFLAHVLLGAVRSDLIEHLRDEPEDRLRAGLDELVRAVLT